MITKTIFISEDGREFSDEYECKHYEEAKRRASMYHQCLEYIENHAVNIYCDDLIRMDCLDECVWSGYVVMMDEEMAKAVSVVYGNTVAASNQYEFIELTEEYHDCYIVGPLKDCIDGIKEAIRPFEELLEREENK